MNSMDEICVPVIKKILGHYLELNPNYNQIGKTSLTIKKYHNMTNNCYINPSNRKAAEFLIEKG